MINHHPSEELLQTHARGSLDAGAALVLSCHLEACPECRRETAMLDALGGAFLEQVAPVELSAGALQSVLARIETAEPARKSAALPNFLDRFSTPKSLRGYEIGARRWVAPGIWFAPVEVAQDSLTYLVYAGKNTTLPRHTHAAKEFTSILSGSYADDLGTFAAGDFSEAGNTDWHAPSVTREAECLCLINSDGPMQLEGFIARTIQSVVGRLY